MKTDVEYVSLDVGGAGQTIPLDRYTSEDDSDTQSSSSEGYSDYASSRDTPSSKSSVSSIDQPFLSCFDAEAVPNIHQPQNHKTERPPRQRFWESANDQPVPVEQRQNPRRSSSTPGEPRPKPPPLIRQSERKECFVACLVGFAAQLVEAIWPLAASTPRTDTSFHGRGVLSLQCFITETLRRSRTSYSTLQVALFYLILLKDHIPNVNFTMEQPNAAEDFQAMQCGRRMFLTALILASKYLQDRNYSTRAWSKISGLRAQEIHTNELKYCKKIEWALHVPKTKFDQWSYTVLALSKPIVPPATTTLAQRLGWGTVLTKLNAKLSERFPRPEDLTPCPRLATMPSISNFVFGDVCAEKQMSENFGSSPSSGLSTETSTPHPPQTCVLSQPPEPVIRNLPTPQSTPQPHPLGTFGITSTPAMSAVMAHCRNQGLVRVTRDQCPPPRACATRWERRGCSSISQTTSLASSPSESVISEAPSLVFSRGSRSSSISSAASCVSAASSAPRLDRWALQRAAGCAGSRDVSISALTSCVDGLSDRIDERAPLDIPFSTSPEEWDQSSVTDSDCAPGDNEWQKTNRGCMKGLRDQELAAAKALCELRPPNPSTPASQSITPTACGSPLQKLRLQAPLDRLTNLSSFEKSARMVTSQDSNQSTPKAQLGKGLRKENNSPSQCHKRTHSKASDPLQDHVQSQLRRSLWQSEMPDRTINGPTRKLPSQSPSRTFGEKKLPIPIKGSDGRKRHCAYQATAVDRATDILRADLHVKPIR